MIFKYYKKQGIEKMTNENKRQVVNEEKMFNINSNGKQVSILPSQEKSKLEILDYIKSEIDLFCSGKYKFEQIGIPKALTRDLDDYATNNPYVRGVNYALEKSEGFTFSPKPYLIYIKPNKYHNTDVICFNSEHEVPKNIELDMERMTEVSIFKVVEKILEVLKIDSDIIKYYISNKVNKQMTLNL